MSFFNRIIKNQSKQQLLENLANKYEQKDDLDKYAVIRKAIPLLLLVLSSISIALGFAYMMSSLESSLPTFVAVGVATLLLLLIETTKVYSISHTTKSKLNGTFAPLDYLFILMAVLTLYGSVNLAYLGTTLTTDTMANTDIELAQSIVSSELDSINTVYQSKVTAIEAKIASIENSMSYKKLIDWKHKTYVLTNEGKQRIASLESNITEIKSNWSTAIDEAKSSHAVKLEKLDQESGNLFAFLLPLSLFNEIFIVLMSFMLAKIEFNGIVQNGRFKVYNEEQTTNDTFTKEIQTFDKTPENKDSLCESDLITAQKSKEDTPNKIGFETKLNFNTLQGLLNDYQNGTKDNSTLTAKYGLNIHQLNQYRKEVKKFL